MAKKKKTISIHIKEGIVVLDVAGIPKDTEVVITDVDTLEEATFTSENNCQ